MARTIDSKKSRMVFKGRSRPFLKVGAETKTWAPMGAAIGVVLGFALGLFVAYTAQKYEYSSSVINMGGDPNSMYFLLIGPLIGLIFGGFAGAFVGIGTPRPNPHPQQGHPQGRLNRVPQN